MVSAGDRAVFVSSMGYDGRHRIWRVRSDRFPGQFAHVSGPVDSMEALVKAAWPGVLERLPWLPDDGGLSPTGYVRRHPLPIRPRHLLPHAEFGDDPSGWCGCSGCDPRPGACGCESCVYVAAHPDGD